MLSSCRPVGPSIPVCYRTPIYTERVPTRAVASGHFPEYPLSLSTPTPRPLKNASDGALMDDNQNEWGDEDLETKKFRVSPVGCFPGGPLPLGPQVTRLRLLCPNSV